MKNTDQNSEHSCLLCIVHDGVFKVAHYHDMRGHYEHAGVDVLKYLSGPFSKHMFLEALKSVESRLPPLEENFKGSPKQVLKAIQQLGHVNKEARESLLFEYDLQVAGDAELVDWVYVIDFNTQTFETYMGNHEEKLGANERFAEFSPHWKKAGKSTPVKHVSSHYLFKLPSPREYAEHTLSAIQNGKISAWINEKQGAWF